MKSIMIIALALVVVISLPFILLWSLNTLFGVAVNYSFEQWLAAAFLYAAFSTAALKK